MPSTLHFRVASRAGEAPVRWAARVIKTASAQEHLNVVVTTAHAAVSGTSALLAIAVAVLQRVWLASPASENLKIVANALFTAPIYSVLVWLVTATAAACVCSSRTLLRSTVIFVAGWVLLVLVVLASPQAFVTWFLD